MTPDHAETSLENGGTKRISSFPLEEVQQALIKLAATHQRGTQAHLLGDMTIQDLIHITQKL